MGNVLDSILGWCKIYILLAHIFNIVNYTILRGCYFHKCDICHKKFVGDEGKILYEKNRRQFLIENLDEYIEGSECVYKKTMKNEQPNLYFLWHSTKITQDDIINAIKNEKIFGLCKVDISCPKAAQKKYLDLNFPPIFRHVSVTENMLQPKMLAYAGENNVKFPLDKQLTLTFNAKEIILATPMLKYYLDNGLKIDKIYYVVEYLKQAPFKVGFTHISTVPTP